MTATRTAQERANDVAAAFNRMLRKTYDAPMIVEKVAMLHLTKRLLSDIEDLAAGDLRGVLMVDHLKEVKRDLLTLENICRVGGLYEAFASLSRTERRRLTKVMEAGQ